MKRHRNLLLVALLAATAVMAAQAAPKALLDKLESIAGRGNRDCGTVLLETKADAAIACAEEATASAQPYRMAIEFKGTDGPAWQGAARDPNGRLWALYFDSDPAAPAGTGDTLSVVPCSEIRFAAKGDDVIQCKPILGRRQ